MKSVNALLDDKQYILSIKLGEEKEEREREGGRERARVKRKKNKRERSLIYSYNPY